MTPSPPWFRFYSETLTDRKIDRICRITEQPKVVIIGAWSILMALANDSPIRGILLLTEDMPFTLEELADEMGLPVNMALSILDEFERFDMLHQNDGTYYLTNWDKRQFTSDSSTERVRRHRERKQEEEQEDVAEADTVTVDAEPCNADVTLQERYSNAPEQSRSDTDQRQSRSDTDNNAGKPASAASESRSPPGDSRLTEGQRQFLNLFGGKRYKNNTQRDLVLELEKRYGTDKLLAAGRWAALKGMSVSNAVGAVEKALPKWGTKNGGEMVKVSGL